MANYSNIDYLINQNLLVYNEMKKNTIIGEYIGLRLIKRGKNDYNLIAIDDIEENTFLFEIGGEILLKKDFIVKKNKLKIQSYCYFYLKKELDDLNSIIILIMEKGNIAFFINQGNNLESNLNIKTFLKPDNRICILCISSKKIKNQKSLVSTNILRV